MTCTFAKPPTNLDEWLSLVNTCATSVGGEGWVGTAILGAQAAVLLFALAVIVGYVVGRVAR